MSKIFYDHLISLENIEKEVKALTKSPEEREEVWNLVDEIVHHRVIGCILDHLHPSHHQDFLERFHKAPYDDSLIEFLKEKIGENIEDLIRQEIGNLAYEILQEIKFSSKK